MSRISFRRYTSLPFLLDIMQEKRLALLDPLNWEDRNDSFFIEQYKQKKNLKSVLALCFAEASETYQHWKIYSGNPSGVCVVFDKNRLINKIARSNGFRSKPVRYINLADLQKTSPAIDELPFIKRVAFRNEDEFRIIFENGNEEINVKYIQILPKDIVRIIINPWVNRSVFNSIKSVFRGIDGFGKIQIWKSGVVDNEKWKNIGTNAIAMRKK